MLKVVTVLDLSEPPLENLRVLSGLYLFNFLGIPMLLAHLNFFLKDVDVKCELVVASNHDLVLVFLLSKPIDKLLGLLVLSDVGIVASVNEEVTFT